MRVTPALLLLAFASRLLAAGQPHVEFTRTISPPVSLGAAESVTVIYALGDNAHLADFVATWQEKVNASGTLRLEDATRRSLNFIGARADRDTALKLQRQEPADAYLGVKEFTCTSVQRGGERSVYDADKKRVKRERVWIESACTARVDVLSATDLHRVTSFEVKGEGASSRVDAIGDEEREVAMAEAAKFAAIDAAEHITPRRVRESLVLIPTVPEFEEAIRLIELDRIGDARVVWQRALDGNRTNAALHYNLGAVCEALGEIDDARIYYSTARKLQPHEPRYKDELRSFMRRHMLASRP